MFTLSSKHDRRNSCLAGIQLALVLFIFLLTQPCWADTTSLHWKVLTFLNENALYTIDQYARWLEKNIVYKADESTDRWADPLETLRKRSGDCEDFAFLSAEVLRTFGYQPLVLAVGRGQNAHVICIFKRQNVYYAFDNNQLNKTNQTSLEAMARFFAHSMKAEFVLELSRHPNKVLPLYVIKETGEIVRFSGNTWLDHK